MSTRAWQPIASAPKDGTYVLVWPPTYAGVASCARWDADRYAKKTPRPYWSRLDAWGRVTESRSKPPTHWMSVPWGPAGAEEQESR
jgi:hypothetical protein